MFGLRLARLILQSGDLTVEVIDLGLKFGILLLEGVLVLHRLVQFGHFRVVGPRGDASGPEGAGEQ